MRTIPAAISTGLANGERPIWLVKIEASGGNTLYWTTLGKNRNGNALVLKETSAGQPVTYDSGMIADDVDGETKDGIGPMESGVDIYLGGGVGSVSDLSIEILNQERFDQAVIAAGLNIEIRPISVYFGFLPDGPVSPIVLIDTHMLLRWKGMVIDVMDFSHSIFTLRCEDATLARYKNVPNNLVDSVSYPNAPKESIGKAIPIVYGSFYDDEDLERDFETISPVPSIKVDDAGQKFLIAGHACYAALSVYTFAGENNLFGKMQTPDNATNAAGEMSFDYVAGGTIIATFRQIPRLAGAGTTAADPEHISDGKYDTWTDVGHDKGTVYRMMEPPKEVGELCDATGGTAIFTLRAYMMGVTDYEAGMLYLSMDGFDLAAITMASIVTGDTTTTVSWAHFNASKFGIVDGGAVAMTAAVRHLVVEYHVKAYNLTRSNAGRAVVAGGVTRAPRGTR
jgi:hypothetical protein